YKIRGKYYHIIVDGTGLATSKKKYNKNCLVKNKTDKRGKEYQEYSTYALEAKLLYKLKII
ncbi:MAG: transposase, partial [Clostridia bacterium]